MRGAVFDLDGTLADTSADLIEGANRALRRMGAGATLDPVRDAGLSGRGGRAMLRAGLQRAGRPCADADVEAGVPGFLADYEAVIADRTRLFPGVEAALDVLEAAGWRLAVCTNKPERLARVLLEALGVAERFSALVGADTLPVRKPDPRPLWHAIEGAGARRDRSVLVGDTATDRETARNAGAPSVLVDFGLSADVPQALAPDAIVAHFDELPAALEALMPRREPA